MSAVFGYGSLIWKVSTLRLLAISRLLLTSCTPESAMATRLHARVHQGARQEVRAGLA